MTTTSITVTFKKRTAEQIASKVALNDASVPTVTTLYDFSNLTEEQILQWAVRGVTIHVQAGIKAGTIDENDLNDATFLVPEPGDRKRLTVDDKFDRLAAEFLGIKVADMTDAHREKVKAMLR